MNFVEPIRSKKHIAQIKNLLRGQERHRDLLLFVAEINTALRISDLLSLQISHFLDDDHNIRRHFQIREQKRGKRHDVVINDSIRETLQTYLTAYPDITRKPEHFAFFSTQADTTYAAPIRRGQAWKFISAICRDVGLGELWHA